MIRPIPISPLNQVDIPIPNSLSTNTASFGTSKVPFSPIQYTEINNPRKRRAVLPKNENIIPNENKSSSIPNISQELLNLYLPLYQAQLLLQQNMMKQTLMPQNLSNSYTQQQSYASYHPAPQIPKNKKPIQAKPINTYPQKRKLELTPLDILVEIATTHPDFADGIKKDDNVFCSTCCRYKPSYCFREVKKPNCKNMCIDCHNTRQRCYYRAIKSKS